jgi:hypothetical protein
MGIGRPTREQGRGAIRKAPLDGILAVIEGLDLLQETHRLQLIDGAGLGLVATAHRISRQTQHVANPEGMGSQQIGLKGQAVAITAGQLQHRLKANVQQAATNGQAAHSHHGPTAISDIHRMDPSTQMGCRIKGARHVRSTGWRDLSGEGKSATGKNILKQRKRSGVDHHEPQIA